MREVFLLDVFSYSCMNCLRSLEYIKKLDARYGKFGLRTVIIHPPEWEFEKQEKDIVALFKEKRIKLPVILDKNKNLLKNFDVDFWPTQILLMDGIVFYKHVGEGNYKNLENHIKSVLRIRTGYVFRKEPKYSRLPCIYTGKKKNGKLLKFDSKLVFGSTNIDNNWAQKKEFIESKNSASRLKILGKGKIINFVASSKKDLVIKTINNKKIKLIKIKRPKMYRLANIEKDKKLELAAPKGVRIYSFSFE